MRDEKFSSRSYYVKSKSNFRFWTQLKEMARKLHLPRGLLACFFSPSLCPYFCLVITSFLSGVRIGSPLTSQFVSCSSKSGHVRHVFHHNGTAPDPDGVIINILSKLRTSNFSHDNSTYISFQFLFFPFRNNR